MAGACLAAARARVCNLCIRFYIASLLYFQVKILGYVFPGFARKKYSVWYVFFGRRERGLSVVPLCPGASLSASTRAAISLGDWRASVPCSRASRAPREMAVSPAKIFGSFADKHQHPVPSNHQPSSRYEPERGTTHVLRGEREKEKEGTPLCLTIS